MPLGSVHWISKRPGRSVTEPPTIGTGVFSVVPSALTMAPEHVLGTAIDTGAGPGTQLFTFVALGASAQYQKSKGGAEDYSEVSADLLFEKNSNGGGTVTLEAAFYKYFASTINLSYFATLSYLTPEKLGWGYIQPLVRLQQAKPVGEDIWTIVEAQLGYVIADDAARLALGYQWQKAGGVKSNALYLGLQLMK